MARRDGIKGFPLAYNPALQYIQVQSSSLSSHLKSTSSLCSVVMLQVGLSSLHAMSVLSVPKQPSLHLPHSTLLVVVAGVHVAVLDVLPLSLVDWLV